MTTAGTRVQLVSTTVECVWVVVTALSTNTNVVTVGGSGVVGAAGTRAGIGLAAGQSVALPVDDASDVWLDSVTSGEGVSYCVGL